MRFRIGLICVALSAAWTLLRHSGMSAWECWTAAGIAVLGLFQLFEAWQGWCALRALGLRTRL